MKIILYFIILVLSIPAFAQIDTIESDFNYTITRYSKMPSFPGGYSQLKKFINTYAIYTEKARFDSTEGKVIVSFIVDEKGKIKNIKILKGLHNDIDSIVINLVKHMPVWEPAERYINKVSCKYLLPIDFKLENTQVRENAKPSKYWSRRGKKELSRLLQKKYKMTEDEFNCWYRFIYCNYNSLKIKDIILDELIENFSCE
ncbi:energy transducer TonB [Saccharicrinis sp. FJH62]|uniref:energy transducer TonB n=1 Tax=Saccharicrinis sp. FJH62 TaxID=3344657 RepID=UPI0035D440C5